MVVAAVATVAIGVSPAAAGALELGCHHRWGNLLSATGAAGTTGFLIDPQDCLTIDRYLARLPSFE